ncbi:sulfite exporter TauE/SafE family protein [Nocardiopsis coralliicola]
MDVAGAVLLVGAGFAAGLVGSMAGLASLFSYPALLAVGLPPIAANVTNTVALSANTLGAALGSREELRGRRRLVVRLCAVAAAGGAVGAWLLLSTDDEAFALIVPALVAFGSVVLLAQNAVRKAAARITGAGGIGPLTTAVLVMAVGVYGGYFGAAAGVLMLAVLSVALNESLAVNNALKNLATGGANAIAAISYAVLAPVDWAAAAAVAVGCFAGARIGPSIVRRAPERPLRIGVGVAGLGLAAQLLASALG